MLGAVARTAATTLKLVTGARTRMVETLWGRLPKICSWDLLNNVFRHPHANIKFVVVGLGVMRQAARFLELPAGFRTVERYQAGCSNWGINVDLVRVLCAVST
jgi:hypothetical protein